MSARTIRGIAEAVGVSPATVSRSLNNSPDVSESVRAKVVAEAARRGYELRRRPSRTQRCQRLGFLFFNHTSGPRFSGYDSVIWSGVSRAALQHGYEVTVLNTEDRGTGEGFQEFIARKGVDGLVVRVDAETRQFGSQIAAAGVPHIVIAERYEDDPSVNYVFCNSKPPSQAAIEHLLDLGHRRIAACHSHIFDTDHNDRICGYRQALESAGIEVDPTLIIPIGTDLGAGVAALNRLLAMPEPPTAVFFTDPTATAGAVRRALELGIRVPEELSIVGFDDERLRKVVYPAFTAVCQDAAELGQAAGRWLCRQLSQPDGQTETCRMEIPSFLEINQTTAPPTETPLRISPIGHRLEMPGRNNKGV